MLVRSRGSLNYVLDECVYTFSTVPAGLGSEIELLSHHRVCQRYSISASFIGKLVKVCFKKMVA